MASNQHYHIKPGKIGNFLIDTYYNIEYEVVSAYKKIEHAFVERFLEADDEPTSHNNH